mgnify:CR=1 FL=1
MLSYSDTVAASDTGGVAVNSSANAGAFCWRQSAPWNCTDVGNVPGNGYDSFQVSERLLP